MAELVTEERLSDLDPEEVRLSRFTEGRLATDAIHFPFPH